MIKAHPLGQMWPVMGQYAWHRNCVDRCVGWGEGPSLRKWGDGPLVNWGFDGAARHPFVGMGLGHRA